MRRIARLLLILAAACVAPAHSHHGISNWDLNKDVSLTGTISRLDFINPHSWLHVEVKDADGKSQSWQCEMRSANALRRSGWTVEMFRIGGPITVSRFVRFKVGESA
jgi:hypothetical protein